MDMFTRIETIGKEGPRSGRERLRQEALKARKNKLDRKGTPP
jgi:hypothetical protein